MVYLTCVVSKGSEGSRMALGTEDGIPAVNPAGLSPVKP